MPYKEYHLIKNNAGWDVKEANAQKAVKKFATKNAALQYAIELAKNQNAELVIHSADGKIQDKRSFGNDLIVLNEIVGGAL